MKIEDINRRNLDFYLIPIDLEFNWIDRSSKIIFEQFSEGVRNTGSGKVSKRARPIDPDTEDNRGNRDNEDYYYEDVDERNNPTNEAPVVPPGFLSPSVREYLDLGKSIPGE